MRWFLFTAALVVASTPLEAQKNVRRDLYKITAEELAEYGGLPLNEVISRARPNFYRLNAGGGVSVTEHTMAGISQPLNVYVGSMIQGDTAVLRFIKASEVKEVRYYKPGNSMSPQTDGNAYVIQIVMKDRLKS